jgi:hypothetical protein
MRVMASLLLPRTSTIAWGEAIGGVKGNNKLAITSISSQYMFIPSSERDYNTLDRHRTLVVFSFVD